MFGHDFPGRRRLLRRALLGRALLGRALGGASPLGALPVLLGGQTRTAWSRVMRYGLTWYEYYDEIV